MERIKIEDLNDMLVERVQEVYFNAEIQMINKVKKRVERGIKFEGYNEKKLKEIQELRKEIETISKKSNNIAKKDINNGFVTIYKAGRENVSALPDSILKRAVSYKLQRHLLAMDDILNGTSKHMVRNVDDIYREVTSQSISGVMTGVDTLRQAAQKSLNQYAAKGITGFVDKAGRKWDLQSYATMATRTVANNIAKQGHIDRSVEMGRDLMIVSAHNGACPLCVPWSNKILSISGQNTKYPSLAEAEAAGLFHPNCKHTLLAYDEEDAELDKMLGIEHGEEGAAAVSKDTEEIYEATQKQRYNESQIRKWKRIEAASLNNTQAMVARNKIAEYQYKNRELTDKYGLKRDYSREGNIIGDANKAIKYKDYPAINLQEQVAKNQSSNFIKNEKIDISPVADKYSNIDEIYFDSRTDNDGDLAMAKLAEFKKMDGLPQLVNKEELEQSVKNGDIRVYRGIEGNKANEYINQYKTGKCYQGYGAYGNGTYVATSYDTAFSYSGNDKNSVMEMTINKEAKVIDYGDLRKELARNVPRNRLALEEYPLEKQKELMLLTDPGRYAMVQGYDAIKVSQADEDYYVILNRSALKILN